MPTDPSAPGARSTSRQPGSVLLFFALAFLVAWACFIPVATAIPLSTPLGRALVLIGAISPSFVATALTWRSSSAHGVRALWDRVFLWRVPARWYLFAVGFTVTLELTSAVLHRLITGAWPRFGDVPWPLIPFVIALSTPVQAGEEVGWRGYALPRLAARFGLGAASIVLGMGWAVWHLPLFFVSGADTYLQSFPIYLLQVTAISVAITWLYSRTGGSLLLPMLLHASINNTNGLVSSALPGATRPFGLEATPAAWLGTALLWLCAAFFLATMKPLEPKAELGLTAPTV